MRSSKIWKDIVYVSTNTNHEVMPRKCANPDQGAKVEKPCTVLNCPWGKTSTPMKYDKIKSYATCVNIDQIKNVEDYDNNKDYDIYKPRYSFYLNIFVTYNKNPINVSVNSILTLSRCIF